MTNYVFGGDPILAADMNRAINKNIAETQSLSDASATSGTTEASIDQVAGDLVAGRKYKIRWVLYYVAATSTGASSYLARIRSGAGTGGAQLGYTRLDTAASSNTRTSSTIVEVPFTASATGSQTFTGSIQRDSGSDNVIAKGATASPRMLTILADD